LVQERSVPRPRRADAVENRARIVAVAREALTSRSDVRLNAIARLAGVGQGTLYRHFPSREALLVEVYRHEVQQLIDDAAALLDAHEPVDALSRWFERLATYARVKKGVFDAVQASTSSDAYAEHQADLSQAFTLLLDAGAHAGVLRDDVDAADVTLLVSFLTRLDDHEPEARARRLLGVLLDGLRRLPAQD